MVKTPVWIDCDPGIDDAAALMTAIGLEQLELTGVSAVAGNAALSHTYENARRILYFTGSRCPVFRGAAQPILRSPITAAQFHGADGLNGVRLPPANGPEEALPAWDALYAAAAAHPGQLVLIATGPLTNAALALTLHPELKSLLRQIVIMGGAAVGGNITSCAEFNIYADPEAAQIVFSAGLPLVMAGLDVTMQAYITAPELDMLADGGRKGRVLREMLLPALHLVLDRGQPGLALHDVCPVLYVARPNLFTGRLAGVYVETQAVLTLGKTVTDLESDQKFPSRTTQVLLEVDRTAFLAAVCSALAG